MLLLLSLARPPLAAALALAADLPLDAATIIVLVVAVGFPLLVWWANRRSVIERYSSPPEHEGSEDSPSAPSAGAGPSRRGE